MGNDAAKIYDDEAAKCAAEGLTAEATSRRCLRAVELAVREDAAKECDALASVEGIAQKCAAAIRAMGRG